MKKITTLFITGLIILGGFHAFQSAYASGGSDKTVKVFFNEACGGCAHLVKEDYPELFKKFGYSIELLDYVNERENRKTLNRFNQKWEVPFELQSHIEAFVGDRLLLGGHVPKPIIYTLLENPDSYEKLLVYQDKMHGEETDYKVWDFKGDIKTFSIDEPITTYLSSIKSGHGQTAKLPKSRSFWGLFGVITGSAFLDGLNPCAFAVLLFFIAFLYTIKRTKASIWKMGLTYVCAIFLAYFLIGIGLAQAFIISGSPHLMAKVGAYLVIALGTIQLLGIVFPAFPIKLRIPVNTKATLEKWLYKATLPASFIGGFIVGLCTFPCSGGIYVAIIGLLTSSQTHLTGLGWMVWYNLIFISPLIIMLLMASSPKATDHLQKWERSSAKLTKIIIGLTMIALGAIILIFFT